MKATTPHAPTNAPTRHPDLLRRFVAVIFSLVLAMTALSRANAADANDTRVNVRVEMLNGTEVMIGEPIVLQYTVANLSRYSIGTDPGIYDNNWYRLKLADPDGKAAPSLPDPRPLRPVGARARKSHDILPFSSRKGGVVVTQYLAPARPGKYTLTFEANLPYVTMEPGTELIELGRGALKSSGTTVKKTFTFPLTVREGTPEGLRRAADGLRKKFTIATDPDQKQMLADALFSMPASATLPVWKRLAFDAVGTNRMIIANALVRTYKNEAADVLVRMEFNYPTSNVPKSESLLPILQDMSVYGTPELSEHIRKLLAPYRVDVTKMPGAID